MEEKHTCEVVVLQCIDFRIRKSLHEYLIKLLDGGYDLISVAGGVKRLLEDPPENNFLLEQFQISNRLHSPQIIILIQHEDCGAYGGSKAFEAVAEEDFQKEELQKAETFLKNHFTQKVKKYFIRLSGEIISCE